MRDPSPLEVVRTSKKEAAAELGRLAGLTGGLTSKQQARWNELTTEHAQLEEREAELEEHARRVDLAGPIGTAGYDDAFPSPRSEARSVALRNIDSVRGIRDEIKQAATQVVEA